MLDPCFTEPNILEYFRWFSLNKWVGPVYSKTRKDATNSLMTSFSIPFVPPTMVKFVDFHSLRMWAKSLQIFGPSSHELPIRVCENTGGSGLVTWLGLWPIGGQFGECSLGGQTGSVFRLLCCCCCLLRSMLSFTDYRVIWNKIIVTIFPWIWP